MNMELIKLLIINIGIEIFFHISINFKIIIVICNNNLLHVYIEKYLLLYIYILLHKYF